MVDGAGYGGKRFCFVWVLNIEFATEDNSDPTKDAFEVSVTARILIQKSHFFSVFIEELTCLKHLLISQNWVCRRIHRWCWHLGVVMQGLVLWQQLVVHAFFPKKLNGGRLGPSGWQGLQGTLRAHKLLPISSDNRQRVWTLCGWHKHSDRVERKKKSIVFC